MKPKNLSEAKTPELRGSLDALKCAAKEARRIAIQTGTAIIVVRDGKRLRISAEELSNTRPSIVREAS